MKIEKINDNQIRCTLTRADLEDRQLKLSELAYGSEKAKSLFHDMMQQAAFEFGFEAEDIPLMIEAIPSGADSIVLIITKVEDPEELDTRFSRFAPSSASGADATDRKTNLDKLEGAEDFLQLLNKVKEAISAPMKSEPAKKPAEQDSSESAPAKKPAVRLFSFGSLDSVIRAAAFLQPMYDGMNTLYKDVPENVFILALTQSELPSSDFNRICNMLSEYGTQERASGASLAYLEEHCDLILAKTAVQQLAEMAL